MSKLYQHSLTVLQAPNEEWTDEITTMITVCENLHIVLHVGKSNT